MNFYNKHQLACYKSDLFSEDSEISRLSTPKPENIQKTNILFTSKQLNQSFANPRGFFSIQKEIKQLQQRSDLPKYTQKLLKKIYKLAEKFELLLLQAENEGINQEIVNKSHQLQEQFVDLHKQAEQSSLEGLSYEQVIMVHSKMNKTLCKMTDAAAWIHFKNKWIYLEAEVSHHIQQIFLYQTFENPCGLSDISHSRGFDSLYDLIQSFMEITEIYEKSYQQSREENSSLKLAKIELLQASLERISCSLMDHGLELNDLLTEIVHQNDCKAMKEVKHFISKELPLVKQALKRLSALTLYKSQADLKVNSSNWIEGIFEALSHPIKTLQKTFDTIEKMSPLPSYSASSLIEEKEAAVTQAFSQVNNFLKLHLFLWSGLLISWTSCHLMKRILK